MKKICSFPALFFISFISVVPVLVWVLHRPTANTPLRQIMDQSQRQLDDYQYEEAMKTALRGQSLLIHNSADSVELYCLLTACAIKQKDSVAVEKYWNQVGTIQAEPSLNGRAYRQYLEAYNLYVSGNFDGALAGYKAAYDLYAQLPKPLHSNAARTFNNTALILIEQKYDYVQAIAKCKQANQLFEAQLGHDHPMLAHAYHNIGMALFNQRRVNKSALFYQKALDLRSHYLGMIHSETLASLNGYATAMNDIGEHDEAKRMLDLALKPALEINDQRLLTKIYANLGAACAGLEKYKEAIMYYEKGLEIERAQTDTMQIAITLYNISTMYRDIKDYKKAIYHSEEWYKLAKKGDENYAEILAGSGFNYEKMGDYEKAEERYKQVAVLNNGNDMYLQMLYNYNMASLRMAQKRYAEALEYIATSKSMLGYTQEGHFDQVFNILSFLEAMMLECRIREAISSESGQIADFQTLQKTCMTTIEAFEYHARNLRTPTGRKLMTKILYPVIEIALRTNQQLQRLTGDPAYWTASLNLAERSKNMRLYEAMQRDRLYNGTFTFEEREKLYHLQAVIDSTKVALLRLKSEPESAKLVAVQHRQAIAKTELQELEKKLNGKYNLKDQYSATEVANLEDIRQMLRPQQSFIEYFVGDSTVFIFLIRANDFQVEEIKKGALEEDVRNLSRVLNAEETSQGRTIFTEKAYTLYNQLLASLPANPDHQLIVVPDGPLYYLPFEALLTSKTASGTLFKKHPFLIQTHCIGYAYSATLLRIMRTDTGRKPSQKGVLALAPFYDPTAKALFKSTDPVSDTLRGLSYTKAEIEVVGKYWPVKALYNDQATFSQFRNLAPYYPIVHFATHGGSNVQTTDNTYLAFGASGQPQKFERIYPYQLANIPLSADLLVFSACQAGIGQVQLGEGVFSIARAGAEAGAKSMVTTLWNVEEPSTAFIMGRFYQYLAQKKSKDEALRQAKLDYTMSEQSPKSWSPWQWAGFIPIGDMRPF
jgi:CHAT domain-containing protein